MVLGSGTTGRIGLLTGTGVSPVSTSMTDSAARVGDGVAARRDVGSSPGSLAP